MKTEQILLVTFLRPQRSSNTPLVIPEITNEMVVEASAEKAPMISVSMSRPEAVHQKKDAKQQLYSQDSEC